MTNAITVSDSLSNANEQIERAALAIGKSKLRRKVFEAIYHHKAKVKSVAEVARAASLSRMKVLQAAGYLRSRGIVKRTKKDTDTAYEKIDFFHAHKKEILKYAGNKKKLKDLPTKRRTSQSVNVTVKIPASQARAIQITIDHLDSFSKTRKVKPTSNLPSSLSESAFKKGIARILGDRGDFKDWGGEKSDLFTTRVEYKGKRRAAAFAFKGPGVKGKLVPSRMGKNGDQSLRLFQEPADIFLVQHWREIDSSVVELLKNLAMAKAALSAQPVWFGIIDGQDSERIRQAYASHFGKPNK